MEYLILIFIIVALLKLVMVHFYLVVPEGLTVINLEKMNFNNYQPKCVITKVIKTTFDDD